MQPTSTGASERVLTVTTSVNDAIPYNVKQTRSKWRLDRQPLESPIRRQGGQNNPTRKKDEKFLCQNGEAMGA